MIILNEIDIHNIPNGFILHLDHRDYSCDMFYNTIYLNIIFVIFHFYSFLQIHYTLSL